MAEHAIENYEARQTCKLSEADMQKIRELDGEDGANARRYWDMCCAMGLPCYLRLQDGPKGLPAPADFCVDPWRVGSMAVATFNKDESIWDLGAESKCKGPIPQ